MKYIHPRVAKNLLKLGWASSLEPQEVVMSKAYVAPVIAGAFLFGLATAAMAGEFDNMCSMGLAMGKEIKTDCSINEVIAGRSYCFANDEAKTTFMKDPTGNLAKAKTFYSTKHPA
jgi:YHS domain-containing protein